MRNGGRFNGQQIILRAAVDDIRKGGPQRVSDLLVQLQPGHVCVVDAVSYRDLEVFVLGLLNAEAQGKNFLYRTAASFVQVRSGITPRPLLTAHDLVLPDTGGGLMVVGSHVPRTSEQLDRLLIKSDIARTEVSVEALIDEGRREDEIERVAKAAEQALNDNQDTVIHTSRQLVAGKDTAGSLTISQMVSRGLVEILGRISSTPRYILSKGGITSSDVATEALAVKQAMVCGQILPGVPVWQLGKESRFPKLAYIVFPGNVGDAGSLLEIYNKLNPNRQAK